MVLAVVLVEERVAPLVFVVPAEARLQVHVSCFVGLVHH